MPDPDPGDDRDLDIIEAFGEQDYVTALAFAQEYLEEWWDPLVGQIALISQRWLGEPERERMMLEDIRSATENDFWYAQILKFHSGAVHIGELLDLAETPEQFAEAYFAAGMRALTDGDETGGRAWLQQCAETHVETLEPEVALRELDRLEEDGGLAGRLHRFLETMRDALEEEDWDTVHTYLPPSWRLLKSGTGSRHPLIGPLALFHAEALHHSGDHEEAVARVFQAVEATRADTGPGSPLPLVAARAAQEILFSWGDSTSADDMADMAGAARLGGGPEADQALLDAAVAAFRVGDFDTAFHAYEDAFAHQDPEDTPERATERLRWAANAMVSIHDPHAATKLLERLHDEAHTRHDVSPPALADALSLVIVLRRTGRIEEAAALFEETISLVETTMEWDDEMHAEFYDFLAERHEEVGLFEHAEELYEEVVERYRKMNGDEAPDLVLPLIGLGRVYLATDRPHAALETYRYAKRVYEKNGLKLLLGFLEHGRVLDEGLIAATGAVQEAERAARPDHERG